MNNKEILNAANRKTFISNSYDLGESIAKKNILNKLPKQWSALHKSASIHIHDLDAYEFTYNCLTFNMENFPYYKIDTSNDFSKIIGTFDQIKFLISKFGNEQSGGMAFANFDQEIYDIFKKLKISSIGKNEEIIKECIKSFIWWCNDVHERMGQTSYYVTLNIGTPIDSEATVITSLLLDIFKNMPFEAYKPNIVFKVKKGINFLKNDKWFWLLNKSLLCTSKKMIPTYICGDSDTNKNIDIRKISVVGCRSRVYNNLFNKIGSIGRGNIANITINLPQIALKLKEKHSLKIESCKKEWLRLAKIVKNILIDRYKKLCDKQPSDFPINQDYQMWCVGFNSVVKNVFKHGTLSIGFIGLSEFVEIVTGKTYWSDRINMNITIDFVSYMRKQLDNFRRKNKLNFSLFAPAAEYVSGRFAEIDNKRYSNPLANKGFYTNSFHVYVDSGLLATDKIRIEGQFHSYCNGGCITYVELKEYPIHNNEALYSLLNCAQNNDIHYLGFNYPKDKCNNCGNEGAFDECPNCGSENIKRMRRVSGYLEITDHFTSGKKHEFKMRKDNE